MYRYLLLTSLKIKKIPSVFFFFEFWQRLWILFYKKMFVFT